MDIGGALKNMGGFIFAPGTEAPSYEALKRRRDIIEALQQRSMAMPETMGEGFANLAQALAARIMNKRLEPQEEAERQKITEALTGMMGGASGGFTGLGGAPTMSSSGGGDFASAISSIESGGKYDALGPVTKKGDRAYGKYQVMGANIPDWSQEALGTALTPDQFLSDPKAQDAVFQHRFGQYAQQYGPEGAASMWFSGDPTPDGDRDQLGTSDMDYVSKFMGALGQPATMSAQNMPMDMGQISALSEVLSNPYATDGQRIVAQALIERAVSGGEAMTPYQAGQLDLARDRLEFDRKKFDHGTREGPKYYGTVQWAERPNPETGEMELAPYQVGSDGKVSWIDLGGATPLPPTRAADLGTSIVPVGPGGQAVGETLVKDVAGTAAQKEVGQAAGTAAAGLGERELAVEAAVQQIDRIVNDPELPSVTGSIQGRLPPNPLNQDATNLVTEIEGLDAKVFANAIDALRGLGAMTEAEGQAARSSLANLSRLKDDKAFAEELNRLKTMLKNKLEAARRKAAGALPQVAIPNDPATPARPGTRLRFNPQTGELEPVQ